MPSTKPEWNSFRPLAFLLAVAQVTSGFWWTGVCNELAMWRLQKAFSNSSATHDNERVKCSDLFVGLSLKVSSRLEIWQTQTLLVAHATSSISSFTCEILTKTSTKSTQRSTKLWNSKPLPNEETKKKGSKQGQFQPCGCQASLALEDRQLTPWRSGVTTRDSIKWIPCNGVLELTHIDCEHACN